MRKLMILGVLALAGCEPVQTAEGCPVMLTDVGQAYTQACIARAREEEARAAGGVVTRCTPVGSGMICTTY